MDKKTEVIKLYSKAFNLKAITVSNIIKKLNRSYNLATMKEYTRVINFYNTLQSNILSYDELVELRTTTLNLRESPSLVVSFNGKEIVNISYSYKPLGHISWMLNKYNINYVTIVPLTSLSKAEPLSIIYKSMYTSINSSDRNKLFLKMF